VLTDNVPYADLGADCFEQLNPDRAEPRAIAQLRRLGYEVELTAAV
jgi:hypothetical protein